MSFAFKGPTGGVGTSNTTTVHFPESLPNSLSTVMLYGPESERRDDSTYMVDKLSRLSKLVCEVPSNEFPFIVHEAFGGGSPSNLASILNGWPAFTLISVKESRCNFGASRLDFATFGSVGSDASPGPALFTAK